MKKPTKSTASAGADSRMKQSEALAVAREVMVRRRTALENLAQLDAAEQIMSEDHEVLRALSKD